jgi:hypothetical protein
MYLAAAIHDDTRTRFFDVMSLNGIAQIAQKYPQTKVIYCDETQRHDTAPKADDLFNLLIGRAKPMVIENGWFNCGLTAAVKIIRNVLENPTATIETFVKPGRKTHGYVYAFAHKKQGWIKVGMTSKDDDQRCWDRVNDYIKAHELPAAGWEFVGFIACMEALKLEKLIHRKLKKFGAVHGKAEELFKCNVSVYMAVLDALDDFIEKHSPDMAEEMARQATEAAERARRDAERQAAWQAQREAERTQREAAAREEAIKQAEAERLRREARERYQREQAGKEAKEAAEAARKLREEYAGRQQERREIMAPLVKVFCGLFFAVLIGGVIIVAFNSGNSTQRYAPAPAQYPLWQDRPLINHEKPAETKQPEQDTNPLFDKNCWKSPNGAIECNPLGKNNAWDNPALNTDNKKAPFEALFDKFLKQHSVK